ncbi:MAG: hypothetical protein QNK37_34050 [Acidobacteriota bacterium]|nr:hypothetical protein [Acidobacteriota bacterium]
MDQALQINKPARSEKWPRLFQWAVVLCVLAWIGEYTLTEPMPGSNWRMAYGFTALALLLGVFAWTVRRRFMAPVSSMKMPAAKHWLGFHVYGGLLFQILVLMHSGFRLPVGSFTFWLWLLSLWVTFSGLTGLLLQRWLPRMLASGLSLEVLYERIPELVEETRNRTEKLVAGSCESIQNLYEREIAADMQQPRRRLIYFFDITGGIKSRLKTFQYLARFLDAEERANLDELETLFRAKLEMDAHFTLQYLLRRWLLLHLPAAWLLLLLVALHLFAVWYY